MSKIIPNAPFFFSLLFFSVISFSSEIIYRVDYIIFKFLPNISSSEKFLPPEVTFSDELINITSLKYPEFNDSSSLDFSLSYQDLFQDISVSRIVETSNLQKQELEKKVEMSANQLLFQNDSGISFPLKEIIKKLKRSKNYRVLGHNSWFQEIQNEEEAPNILVKTEIDNGDLVVGEIKAYKKRFLHLDLNLYFAKDSVDPSPFNKEITLKELIKKDEFDYKTINLFENLNINFLYQINHSRKLRSKELHYVDHPKFGVIFQIYPVTKT